MDLCAFENSRERVKSIVAAKLHLNHHGKLDLCIRKINEKALVERPDLLTDAVCTVKFEVVIFAC